MTTLKLKPGAATPPKAPGKPPVRRADPAKRSRTTVPEYIAKASTARDVEAGPGPEKERKARPSAAPHQVAGKLPARPAKSPVSASQQDRKQDGRPRQFDDRDTPRRGGKQRDGFESGEFNQDRKTNPKFSPKPVPSQPELPRLSKRMAELGLCSRREADEFIANGWVKVNGEVVDVLGTRVAPDAKIEVSKEAHQHQAETVTILLHKPVGYVSGQAEDGYEPAVVLVHPDNQWKEDPSQTVFKRGHLRGLAPAGRLDIDSTGLLVLTQDGRVARRLIGEDSTVEKEYLVRVTGTLSEEGLRKLNHGLSLDGVKLKPAKVSWQNEDQLRFVLREGRKRQIRRMCELVGLTVVGLKRVRIGSVTLGKLPVGMWRYLRPGERF
ncbi:pseudouridine synthase [Methylobacillus flagellatus]|uniref:Dual-specificity RNA pseudouridine synthase RluF n=1 Tax=Methylobacillus flagellatus (strain ATCC 51484 / DSM 6875 / VKM B-1610 / KT) TaxID=265072 RepID=Q1GY93_METFK|nr:pseudouridine synthase [Methylobacillus flagellatus]ABE50794.1 Pseudouridine synthase, Rsu [Methylobacillus flagellatus KT]